MRVILLSLLICCSMPARAGLKAYDTFTDSHYSGSGVCSDCHDGLSTTGGEDISIVRHWSNSMMAHAGVDPYWMAKVASELKRNPQLSSVINDKCSRCHLPMANDAASKNADPIVILAADNGFLDPNNPYYRHAREGVSCTLCHQIAASPDLGTLAGFSGNWRVDTYTTLADRPAYGQYSGVNTLPMRNNVQFTPQLGAHTTSSSLCASCHDLNTPFVDAAGNVVSTTPDTEFPEQSPYREWAHSAYADTGATPTRCQDCHMPQVNEAVVISNRPTNLPARNGFARHLFLGANTVMLQMLLDNSGPANDLINGATDLPGYILMTRDFLKQAGEIRFKRAVILDGELTAEVEVLNHSGHKLPTGYPSRRVWIDFEVTDLAGNTLFRSGAPNADGSIQGVDLDSNPYTPEPHYDEITQTGQVQVYEPIMQDTDGNVTHTLLRAASYRKDNRLLPVGFDPATAPADIAVRGLAATDDDFIAGSDTVTYRIQLPASDSYFITARLRFQTLSFGHLQDLFTDGNLTEVADFQAMFVNATIRHELISEATTVPVNDRIFRDSFE